jgi:hypothetical protein
MIDIENFVFGRVSTRLRAKYVGADGAPAIYVYGEASNAPAKFPAVTIVESSNSIVRAMRTTNVENAVNVMYEVNVYSNVEGYGKAQTKEILKEIDAEFAEMGFSRTMANPIANLPDGRIYRMVARYEGVVTAEVGDDDTTYRIYGN